MSRLLLPSPAMGTGSPTSRCVHGSWPSASWDTQGNLCMLLDSRCLCTYTLCHPSHFLLLLLPLPRSPSLHPPSLLLPPSLRPPSLLLPPSLRPPTLPTIFFILLLLLLFRLSSPLHCPPLQHTDNTEIVIPPKHHIRNRKAEIGYYKIARHYKWALTQVFEKMNSQYAIIVEGK